MKDLKFIAGDPPEGLKKELASFLFNTQAHRRSQSANGWHSFHLVNEAKQKTKATAHFHLDGSIARTALSAPFGALEFSYELPVEDLFEFLSKCEKALRSLKAKKVIIKAPPQGYDTIRASISEVLLLNSKYKITEAEAGALLSVTSQDFEDHIDSWETRKLKQSIRAGLEFRVLDISQLTEIYEFILACRLERQQSLSMTLEQLKNTLKHCPKSFFVFGVFNGKELTAASIAIRVHRDIVYNFYSGHPKKMDAVSPIVMLTKGLYEWSRQHNVSMLDLGTSALQGQPNFGLLEFKIRLGAIPSAKFTFEKELD